MFCRLKKLTVIRLGYGWQAAWMGERNERKREPTHKFTNPYRYFCTGMESYFGRPCPTFGSTDCLSLWHSADYCFGRARRCAEGLNCCWRSLFRVGGRYYGLGG